MLNKQKNKWAVLLSQIQTPFPGVPHPAPPKRTTPATAVLSLLTLLCISLLLPVPSFLDSSLCIVYLENVKSEI